MFFNTLSNKLRMDIIESLLNKEKTVNELCKGLRVEQSKLSHSLKSLKECNVVKSRVSGKNRVYSVNKEFILPILNSIKKHSTRYCKTCQRYT